LHVPFKLVTETWNLKLITDTRVSVLLSKVETSFIGAHTGYYDVLTVVSCIKILPFDCAQIKWVPLFIECVA
jgi:hypothetical protein